MVNRDLEGGVIEGAAHDQDGRWRNLDSEGKGVRISSKSNSEDRSSWLCHGRRGWLGGFRLWRL